MARRAVASMNYGPKAVPTDDMVQTFGKLNRATRNMIKDIHKSTYLSSKAKEVLDECKSKKLSRDRARTVLANRLVETLVQNTDRSSGWAVPISIFVYGRAKTNSPYLWKGNIQWEYVAESFMDDYPGESGFTERTETPVRFGKMATSANAKPSLPVGPDGYVPTEAIMRRDAERTARARTMDSRTTARTVFTPPLTPAEASKWWNAPERYDVEGVDTAKRGKTNRSTAKPRGRAKGASDVSQPVGGARAPRGGFFDGLSKRRSGYADLDWVGDPYTASMIAGETLSDDMVRAYRDGAWEEVDRQLHPGFHPEDYSFDRDPGRDGAYASSNRRRRGGRR